MEKSFVDYVKGKLEEQGNTDIVISNINFKEDNVVFADVSYTWNLNGWDKRVKHKQTIFVYSDVMWHSTFIF